MDSTWTVWIDSSQNSPGLAGLWCIWVTSVTPITKKGNYISSDAHFSWHQEYPGHMIYPSFLIEKNEKYWKKCGTSQFMSFLFLEKKLSHLMHNFLGIENTIATWSTLLSLLQKMQNSGKNALHIFLGIKNILVTWSTLLSLLRKMQNTGKDAVHLNLCNFSFGKTSSHLMRNFLGIKNTIVTWSALVM